MKRLVHVLDYWNINIIGDQCHVTSKSYYMYTYQINKGLLKCDLLDILDMALVQLWNCVDKRPRKEKRLLIWKELLANNR